MQRNGQKRTPSGGIHRQTAARQKRALEFLGGLRFFCRRIRSIITMDSWFTQPVAGFFRGRLVPQGVRSLGNGG